MFLLLSFIIAGVMAEESLLTHYHLKNSTICLHVQNKTPPYHNSQWTFAGRVIATGTFINPDYTNKVYYVPENLTLCVRELTERDSGIYKVSFHDSAFIDFSNSHKVIVEDAVPTPVIRMSVPPSNLSVGLCNVTVNCSVQEDWAWSACDDHGCKTLKTSFNKVNISISTDNRTVVCSGNNHVSVNNVSESIEAACLSGSNPDHKEASPLTIETLIIMIVSLVFLLLCISAFLVIKCFSTKNIHHQTHTSNAELIRSQPLEAPPQGSEPGPRASTSSSQADAAYENVDAIFDSHTRNPTIRPNEGSGAQHIQTVDTVYSVVKATAVTNPQAKTDSSKDMKGHKEMQETLQSVPLDEAEHTRQTDREIDTVYSVLQKPKTQQPNMM